jgi:NADPH-dependent ferric siderophore reductase
VSVNRRERPPFVSAFAQVLRTEAKSPRMRRITLGGPDVGQLKGAAAADAIKLVLPAPGQNTAPVVEWGPDGLSYVGGGTPVLRAYSIHRLDPGAAELDITVLTHGLGSGSRWARTAAPGDTVQFFGPRRDYFGIDGDADLLLVAGDETAIGAAAGIAAELPAGRRAHIVLEVTDAADEHALPTDAAVTVTWVHRGDGPPGGPLLEEAVRAIPWPGGRVQAWIASEAGQVRGIRRYLRRERGLDRDALTAFGYWRLGMTGTQLDEAAEAGVEIV